MADTLADAIRSEADLAVGGGAGFVTMLKPWAQRAAQAFLQRGAPLNEQIARIAHDNHLNNDQIQRLVQESNVNVYLSKYAATSGDRSRRVSFPIASLPGVQAVLAGEPAAAPPAAPASIERVADARSPALRKAASVVAEMPSNHPMFSGDLLGPAIGEEEDVQRIGNQVRRRALIQRCAALAAEDDRAKAAVDEHLAVAAGALVKYAELGVDPGEALARVSAALPTEGEAVAHIAAAARALAARWQKLGKLSARARFSVSGAFEKHASLNLGPYSRLAKEPLPPIEVEGAYLPTERDFVKAASEFAGAFRAWRRLASDPQRLEFAHLVADAFGTR